MEVKTETKTEDLSSACEYGVYRAPFATSHCVGKNVNLKDELKSKILERRRKEGKSDINLEEAKIQEPKHYALTKEELERNEKRKKANRVAAQKCRSKKRQFYLTLDRAVQEQLDRKKKLVTAIPELEKEISDIRYLWRLISIPGTKVEASSTEPDKNVAITVGTGKTKLDKGDKHLNDKIKGSVVDSEDNGDEKEMVYLRRCGIMLIIPKSLRKKAEEFDKAPATGFLLPLKKDAEESVIELASLHPITLGTKAEKSDMGVIGTSSAGISMVQKRRIEESATASSLVSAKLLKSEPEETDIAPATHDTNVQSACVSVSAKGNEETIPSFEVILSTAKRPEVTHNMNNRLKELLQSKITTGHLHRDKTKVESSLNRIETSAATNPYTFVIETHSEEYRTFSHNIPTVVTDDLDETDAKMEKALGACKTAWSETAGMKLRTLVSGLSENVELEEVSSVDNVGYNFRSVDENAPHSLSSSQSSNSQDTEYDGYEEMKPDQPIELSTHYLTNDVDTSDSDSDVELIELEERKLVIDLTD